MEGKVGKRSKSVGGEETDYYEDPHRVVELLQVGAEDSGSEPSRPSSRASSGRLSPTPEPLTDMENVALDELPVEKLYEYFAQSSSLLGVVRTFEALKEKLGLAGLQGIRLFRALKEKLSSQKTWKAKEVLKMLDKRANQKEFMQQTAAKDISVLIGESSRHSGMAGCGWPA